MSDPNFQRFFPCVPDYMSWEDWVGNVIIYYGQHNLMVSPEIDWRSGAAFIAQSETFGNYPVPAPTAYDNWQDWARDFTETINGPSR